ncbi:MAG: cytochrome c peroxidase [Bacteroidales bacterium]|nr:cytochrome c peroxidase [Bacteroidales bacterium]
MKKLLILTTAVVLIFAISCKNKQSNEQAMVVNADSVLMLANNMFQPLPKEAANPENAVTPEKVLLGKTLYYDNRLSMHNTQSCNTCHNLATFGVDNKSTSPGDNGKLGTRNSPTSLNSALHFLQFWDGRMKDVEEQAGGPVMNPAEMSMPDEKTMIARLTKNEGYKKMFDAAFPGEKQPVSFTNMRKSIAAFERTLQTPGKFDKFLEGDVTALNEQELKGCKTFMETGCTACHTGPLLGGNMFQKYPLFGTHKELTGSTVDDQGKMQATKNEADKYFFKVPSLRNVAETWPYLHDGSIKELGKTIQIMAKGQLNKELTPEQNGDISAFLKALTGEVPSEAKQVPAMP